MVANGSQSVKWDCRYSVSYGRELVMLKGVDGNNAVAYLNDKGLWTVEFWNGGFAGLLGYRSLTIAAKDMERWGCGGIVPELFMVEPCEENDGQPEDGVYQLNLTDEIEEWWTRIEPIVRAEEALERNEILSRSLPDGGVHHAD